MLETLIDTISALAAGVVLAALFCTGVYILSRGLDVVFHLKDILKRKFQNIHWRRIGKYLQLSIAICVGVIIGGFISEFHAAGNWPQLTIVLCVGVVLGRVIQLNADVVKKIPPLPNRFPERRPTRLNGRPF